MEKCGGAPYLNHLVSIVPTSLDIEHYAQIVYRLSIIAPANHRVRKNLGHRLRGRPDVAASLNRAEDLLFRLRQERVGWNFVHIKTILDKYFEVVPPSEEASPVSLTYILASPAWMNSSGPTAFRPRHPGGRTSMGKRHWLLTLPGTQLSTRCLCCRFQLEMSRDSLVQRPHLRRAEVNSRSLRLGQNTEEEERRIMSSGHPFCRIDLHRRLAQAPDNGDASKARRLITSITGLIVIDYLQLLLGEGRSETACRSCPHYPTPRDWLVNSTYPLSPLPALSRG